MRKLFLSLLLVIIIFTSCQDKTTKSTEPDTEAVEITDTTPIKKEILHFKGTKVLEKKDTLSFDADANDWVNITLTVPKDSGNIRINQIIAPDNTADGPFGRTYNDTLHLSGTYHIIIGSSLMQEFPYAGPYEVTVSFKK